MKRFFLTLISLAALLFVATQHVGAQTPGGIDASNYTGGAWLTPDSYNSGTWTNRWTGSGGAGNFSGATTAPVKSNTGGYNFHPVVTFSKSPATAAPSQLYSANDFTPQTNENVTMFFVTQRASTDRYDYLISFANVTQYSALAWRETNDNLSFFWGGVDKNIAAWRNGILTVDNPNATAGQINVYKNGVLSTFNSPTQWTGSKNKGNGHVALGGGINNTPTNAYGYEGNIQEVILLKKSGNGNLDATDLQKIHSYLAIKYGLTLHASAGNYVNSEGAIVWNVSANSAYNNNVFGIAHDDASGLSQKQSVSTHDNTLTVYMGSGLATLNSDNDGILNNKEYLMLGSNGLNGNIAYAQNTGTTFEEGDLQHNLKYRQNRIYKAQLTGNTELTGVNFLYKHPQMKLVKYLLVSNSEAFVPADTRIYPMTDGLASNVTIKNNEYISFGIIVPYAFSMDVWLKADQMNVVNNTAINQWQNLANGTNNFVTAGADPLFTYNSMNFNPSLNFNGSKRLQSAITYTTADSRKYMTFWVSKGASTNSWNMLFNYGNASGTNNDEGWTPTNTISFSRHGASNVTVTGLSKRYGVIGIDRSGTVYHNGRSYASDARQPSAGNHTLSLGSKGGANVPVNAEILEFMMLSIPSGETFTDRDVRMVNSYLAIKYGQMFEGNVSYYNSQYAPVWNMSSYSAYNNNVFGIARDDATSLYQRQSVAYEDNVLTLFLGAAITAQNSENTGTLNDGVYLMLGSNGAEGMQRHTFGTNYANSVTIPANTVNVMQKRRYRAQLTGTASQTVNMKIGYSKIRYVFVSTGESFDPDNTRVYPVDNSGTAMNVEVNNGEFIGFALFSEAPGGIDPANITTEVWLKADEIQNGSVIANNTAVKLWENLPNHKYNFEKNPLLGNEQAATHPAYDYSGMNFNPTVRFENGGTDTRASAAAVGMSSLEKFTIGNKKYRTFYVSRSRMASSDTRGAIFAFYTYASEGWGSSDNKYIYYSNDTGPSVVKTTVMLSKRYGITSFERVGKNVWHNGKHGTGDNDYLLDNKTQKLLVGTAMGTGDDGYNATYGRTFTGDIQEIIVLSVPSASSFNPTEMNKITSYLAIKYGQSLEGNFVLTNSVGTELWSKITHSSYSNNVFGLGRDDITGLNQKQSVNVEDDVLTAYLGNTLHSISAQNLVHFSEDKTYLLFGSNALNGISSYTYLDGTQFKNKTLTGESFTRRQSRIYKAIHSGSNDSLRVSLRIKHMKAKYVMVSNDASFLPAETRLYPVVDGVASGVAFKGESYVGFVLYGETPDGQATGITTNLWLKADEVQAGEQPADGAALTRWTNSTGILYRDFVQSGTYAVPVYKTDGVNYHPAVRFNTMRLISEQSINYLANVHKRAFYMSTRGATAANHHATLFSYNTHETSLTIEGWRNNQFFLTNYHSDGKMTGDLNKTSGIIRTYRPYSSSSDGIGLVAHNAKRYNIAGSVNYGQFDGNYSPLIGTARRATTDHALIGDIQEFILLEEATSASPAAVANRENKITTYLAVKYGQTLDATDQPLWLTSSNVPIWNAADPNYTSYNKNIFGIGRDDSTTLYQKQSMSAGAIERITVFLGSPILPKLNRQNTGTLENNNFLMFGSNGINPNLSSSHESYIKSAGTTYANSVSLSLNLTHRHKFTLRAKKTGVQQYTVNFCINGVRADYLLVCPDQSFDPSNTRAYPLDGNFVASDVTVTDGDYIGFAFLQKAPGGVASSIRMWLKADEPSSIDLHSTGELQEWRDVSGNPDNIKYSYLQPKTHNKRPGFRKIDPAMNYHPAADFRSLHEFLSTDQAPFSIRNPKQYSFVSVMNIRKFGDNVSGYCNVNENYSYVLGFGWKDTGGDDHENPGGGDENNNRRPGIGFANVNNKGIGRAFFGYDGKYYLNGNKGLYNGNATTASMHIVDVSGQDASTAYMRFEADGEYDHIMQSGGKPEPCSGNGDRTYTELVQQMYNQHHATKHHILMNGAGTLGTGSRSPRQMYGTLGELIAYEGILTDLEKNKVYSYLGLKYGITLDLNKSDANTNFDYFLSDGTTYVWRGTNDATHRKYHNNVAAIVRDDAANLNNLQSHSTDNGAVVLMGIGERIGLEPQLRGLDEDKEFIVWGNNGIGLNQKEEYLPDPLNPERCGDFNDKLRRIWFVDVKTHKDYSVHIGAFSQPNAVGAEAQFPFNGRNHQVFMLIADSEDKILNNNWDMYIEGTYLDGMHQFNFTFEHGKQYYFTFGGKIKEGATPDCEGCPSNSKIKTLNYAGWTNRQISYTRDLASSTDPFNVDVNVAFVPPAGTSTIVGAPSLHYNNRPMNTSGALSLWRTGSGTSGKNIMRTRYTMPKSAIVSFRILEIDYYLGRYNNVEIYGYCGESGTKIFPKLSYVTTPANSTFVIYPNGRASARRIGLLSANNIRGWMNVSFDEPVKEVYFDHWLTGSTSGAKRIAISSLNFNCPSEPPPVNNEGLAFVTRASEYDDVPLCKEVTYTFLITNTSCTPRKVAFNDVLPSGMFWVDGTLNIDPAIVTNNGANVYANSQTLTIDSIFVAGGQTTSFSINAGFADNASEGAYSSQAHIQYKRYIGTALTNIDLPSCDNYKPECQPTVINAIISGDRLNPLTVSPLLVDKTCFKAGDTLTVSFSVSNPNTTNAILQAGLSVNYNGTFTFEPGSLTTDLLDVGTPDFYPEGDGFDLNGISNAGFEIPASATRNISFKLIAPTSSEILLDEDGNPVRDEGGQPVYAPLTIAFGFSSFAEDDCSLALFEHAYGDKEVPVIPNFKITGKNPLCIGENSQVSLWSNGVLSSANPFVATIGNDGKITAVSAGKTVFYFQSTSLGSDCKAVSDTLVVAAPTITGENQLCVNNSITLTAAENGSWTSSDTYKATVNPTTGEVTGIAAGSTTITFTSDGGNCTATHIVTVVAPQQITDFYYSSSSFCSTDFPVAPTFSPPGGTFSVSGGAGTLDLNSSTGEITFTNSDPGVYTVSYTLSPEGCVPVSADFQVTVLNCGDLNLFKDVNTQNICYKDATKRDTVIFTITVDNTSGGSAFNNVEVTEVWDDRFEYFSHNASDGLYDHTTKIWTLGTVIDGQTSTLTIKAVPKNSATASGVNKVFVSRQESSISASYEAATVKDEVSTNIYPFPTISITNPNDLCISGGGVQISASPTGGTFSGGAFVSSTGLFAPSTAGIGKHKVYYSFTNPTGCSSTDSIEVVVSGCTQAINDTVMTVIDQPLIIDVLANDNYPDCNRIDVANSLSFPQQGKHGAATKNVDGTITYTPTAGFFGIDTLTYRINCGNESTATVYIVVLKPGAFSYIACPDATVKLSMAEMQNSWSPQAWVNYKWYDTQTEGTEIIAGVSGTYGETLTHTKTTDNLEVFWLEAKWNNIIFPRYKVELRKSDDCGTTIPTGCAVTGTVLFKEDYGGNAPNDDEISQTGLPSDVTTYTFCSASSCGGSGWYKLKKTHLTEQIASIWHHDYDDHTYPNDPQKGYFFGVDANSDPDKFYEYKIEGLCSNTELYFSAWLANLVVSEHTTATDEPRLRFELSNKYGVVLTEYNTGIIPRTNQASGLQWAMYGFDFNTGNNDEIIMRIYSDGTGSSGNDFVMDDIEIRLCVPKVTIGSPDKSDTAVCIGQELVFNGSYEDVLKTLGEDLVAAWVYSATDSSIPDDWTIISESIIDAPNSAVISSTYPIGTITNSHEGYYRMVVTGAGNVDPTGSTSGGPALRKSSCVAMSHTLHVIVIGEMNGGSLNYNDTVCYNAVPSTALQLTGVSGDQPPYTYLWQYKKASMSDWGDITNSTDSYTLPADPLNENVMYRVKTSGSWCGSALSDTARIVVRPASMLRYPDVRIYACPSASPVNLSKFIDSLGITDLQWSAATSVSPAIDADGIIAGNALQSGATYTYTYKITNSCVSNTVSKVYLHVLTQNQNFRLRTDTVAVCYTQANNLQINRMFGLDDGSPILYNQTPVSGGNSVETHIVKSIAPSKYAGALIFNGSDAYNATNVLPTINYHGDNNAKYMEFVYTTNLTGCLGSKTYKVVVVLTSF